MLDHVNNYQLKGKPHTVLKGNLYPSAKIKSVILPLLNYHPLTTLKPKQVALRNPAASFNETLQINETEQCDNPDGKTNYRGSVFYNNTYFNDRLAYSELVGFDVRITATTCLKEGSIHSGSLQYFSDIRSNTEEISFLPYYIQSATEKVGMGGLLTSSTDESGSITEVFNLTIKNYTNNETIKLENYTHRVTSQPYYATWLSAAEEFEGIIYHSEYGKFIIETLAPFGYESYPIYFPGKNGLIRITGKPGQSIEAAFSEIISGGHVTDHAIDIDIVTQEKPSHYHLTFKNLINDPAFSSLKDSDGDGMPDSWEINYGLEPDNAADALNDTDGDLIANLDEFLALTSPKDENDYPDVAFLHLEIHRDSDSQPVETIKRLKISVKNLGPGFANVDLQVSYPSSIKAAFPYQSVNCQDTGSITECTGNLSLTSKGDEVGANLDIMSTTPQNAVFTFTVTASNVSQSKTLSIPVTFFQHDGYFQDIIDSGNPSSIINIPPGHFIASPSTFQSDSIISFKVNSHLKIKSVVGAKQTHLYGCGIDFDRDSELSGFTIHLSTCELGANNGANFDFSEYCSPSSTCDQPSYQFNFNNNRIYSNYNSVGFTAYIYNDALIFTQNLVRDAITSSGGLFTHFGHSTSAKFTNNIFDNISGTIFSDYGDSGYGYDETRELGVLLANNTFTRNRKVYEFDDRGPNTSGLPDNYSNRIIENNIFYNNEIVLNYFGQGADVLYTSNSPQLSNNIFHQNTDDVKNFESDLTLINNNFSLDPLLKDITSEDYSLTSTSPAIDAGKPQIMTNDFLGNPRKIDGNMDSIIQIHIGAIEFSSEL